MTIYLTGDTHGTADIDTFEPMDETRKGDCMGIELVPSKDVRALMAKLGWELSDRDRAALLHALGLPYARERAELLALKGEMGDAGTAAQVEEYVALQDELLRLFGEAGGFAYTVSERGSGELVIDRFPDLGAAVACGRRLGCAFEVEKHRLPGADGPGARRVVGAANPFLMPPDAGFDDLVMMAGPDDTDWPVAWAAYGADGEMELFGSSELAPSSRADVERDYDPARFENAYVELPSPFEAGDLVRTVGPWGREGEVGVVETGREEWAELSGRLKRAAYADFSDGALVVSFLRGGAFSHGHVPPSFLERHDPPEGDPARELLLCASDLVAGRGGLDWFLLALESYRRTAETRSQKPDEVLDAPSNPNDPEARCTR